MGCLLIFLTDICCRRFEAFDVLDGLFTLNFLDCVGILRLNILGNILHDFEIERYWLRNISVASEVFGAEAFIRLNDCFRDAIPDLAFGFDGGDDVFFGGLHSGVDSEYPHEVSEVVFLSGCSLGLFVGKHVEKTGGRDLDDVQLAEQMFLVLSIDLPFADEDVQEGFFDEHVKDVALLEPEHQIDEGLEKFNMFDRGQDFEARNRDHVAQYFQNSVVVESHSIGFHYAHHCR